MYRSSIHCDWSSTNKTASFLSTGEYSQSATHIFLEAPFAIFSSHFRIFLSLIRQECSQFLICFMQCSSFWPSPLPSLHLLLSSKHDPSLSQFPQVQLAWPLDMLQNTFEDVVTVYPVFFHLAQVLTHPNSSQKCNQISIDLSLLLLLTIPLLLRNLLLQICHFLFLRPPILTILDECSFKNDGFGLLLLALFFLYTKFSNFFCPRPLYITI